MKITGLAGVTKLIEDKIEDKKMRVFSSMNATFFDVVMEKTPVEGGHAHEAWLAAARDAESQLTNLPDVDRAISKHSQKGSGDPKAVGKGNTSIVSSADGIKATIENELGFVKKMEYGIPITPGDDKGNTGVKEDWYNYRTSGGQRPSVPGELYGARLSSGGVGMLLWEEGGVKKRALSRTMTIGAAQAAINAVKTQIK